MYKIFFLIAVLIINIIPQRSPIFFDGRFDDWSSSLSGYVDTQNDGNQHDFRSFYVNNDEDNLYIKLTLRDTFKLLENNSIALYIDGDNNSSTGLSINGIGAELRWNFGNRNGVFVKGNSSNINHSAIQIKALPTVTAPEYEISISRNARPAGNNLLFTSDTIKIVFRDNASGGDVMPNNGEIFYYVFNNESVEEFEPISLEREDENHIRLISYNVEFDGLLIASRKPSYQRILNAINPDIICFNEFFNSSVSQVKLAMDEILPLGTPNGWFAVKLDAGNVLVSKFPIIQNWVVYAGQRISASLINLSSKYEKNLLVINAHLRCCTAEEIRQREADAIISFLKDAKQPGGNITLPEGTPFALAGDLNLVGDYRQLRTLLTGEIVNTNLFGEGGLPDWDDTELEDLYSSHTDRRYYYTWSDESSSFPPGRLDFFIYSNSVLEIGNNFILNTSTMSNERLTNYGLFSFDSRTASDHFPKVQDLKIPLITNLNESNINPGKFDLLQNYPNPFNPVTVVSYQLPVDSNVSIKIYDVLGNEIAVLVDGLRKAGKHSVTFNAEKMSSGIYYYQLKAGEYINTKKMVLLR